MTVPAASPIPLPGTAQAVRIVGPEGPGPGNWAGAPSAIRAGGEIWLAYRMRRPVGEGRGGSNVVARSSDGENFTTVWSVSKEAFGAESLERPWLTRGPDGTWFLYVSCATPGTKHWRVDLLRASDPASFDAADRVTVFPGDAGVAMKDPVIRRWRDRWHAWVCCHPLGDPGATDRMWTSYATSHDGVTWDWHGAALEPVAGRWDSRGTRIADVWLHGDHPVALYDGRATAEENFEERTGIADGEAPHSFRLRGDAVAAESPSGGHGLRYTCLVPPAEDGDETLIYYEAALPDGSHDLRMERVRL